MEEENKKSSRTPIVDIIENIWENIAIQSHLWELYTSIVNEIEENIKDMDKEMQDVYLEDKRKELEDIKIRYENIYQNRRKLMEHLKWFGDNVNMDYWCLVKHSIAVWQYSKELWDTNRDNVEYESLFVKSSENMYQIISKFLWVEVVKCWRCLLDEMWE